MLDWIKNAFSGSNLSGTLQGLGALGTAFMQYENNKLQKDMYDYEKASAEEEKKRRAVAQAELDEAVASVWS